MNNLIVDILNKEEDKRREQMKLQEWGVGNRNRLVKILEDNGAIITNHMWDLLLSHINGLRISKSGRVCYLSFYKPSKKILSLLARYNKTIVEHFNEIVK